MDLTSISNMSLSGGVRAARSEVPVSKNREGAILWLDALVFGLKIVAEMVTDAGCVHIFR